MPLAERHFAACRDQRSERFPFHRSCPWNRGAVYACDFVQVSQASSSCEKQGSPVGESLARQSRPTVGAACRAALRGPAATSAVSGHHRIAVARGTAAPSTPVMCGKCLRHQVPVRNKVRLSAKASPGRRGLHERYASSITSSKACETSSGTRHGIRFEKDTKAH